jgi:hypothetical protein
MVEAMEEVMVEAMVGAMVGAKSRSDNQIIINRKQTQLG